MAFKYLLEDASGGFQLEDGSGVLLLDDGASYAAALDTTYDLDLSGGNAQLRLRIGIENTGGGAGASAFKLRYSKNGGAYADVTSASSNVKVVSTTYFADGDDVPQLITSGTYQSDNNAAEDSTGAFTLTAGLAAAARFEAEIALEFIAADLADNDSLDFRVTQSDATVLDTYTVTANVTINKVTGRFTRSTFLNQTINRAAVY